MNRERIDHMLFMRSILVLTAIKQTFRYNANINSSVNLIVMCGSHMVWLLLRFGEKHTLGCRYLISL